MTNNKKKKNILLGKKREKMTQHPTLTHKREQKKDHCMLFKAAASGVRNGLGEGGNKGRKRYGTGGAGVSDSKR